LTPGWQQYQDEAAAFFRDLGFTATVDETIQGVRARHRIDVWVVFQQFGIVVRWVVECKECKRRIPKERVGALKSVVDDIGADHGFLVAENGFQQGAIDAARATNITLATLSELRARAEEDLQQSRLDVLSLKATELEMRALMTDIREATVSEAPAKSGDPDFDVFLEHYGALSAIPGSVARSRLFGFPVHVGMRRHAPNENREVIRANSATDLVRLAEESLSACERWITKREEQFASLSTLAQDERR
jgi:hypothetical protein